MGLEVECKILGKIAEKFPRDSVEYLAIEKASLALLHIEENKAIEKFKKFIENNKAPITGLQLIHMKMYGIDLPKELITPELKFLEIEIEALVKRLNSLIAQGKK